MKTVRKKKPSRIPPPPVAVLPSKRSTILELREAERQMEAAVAALRMARRRYLLAHGWSWDGTENLWKAPAPSRSSFPDAQLASAVMMVGIQ
jgi:hypothetical protein